MNKYEPLVELYKGVCVHGILVLWNDDLNSHIDIYKAAENLFPEKDKARFRETCGLFVDGTDTQRIELYNHNMQRICPNDAMNAFFEHLILRHKRLGHLGISFFERKIAHLLTPSEKGLQKKLDEIAAKNE